MLSCCAASSTCGSTCAATVPDAAAMQSVQAPASSVVGLRIFTGNPRRSKERNLDTPKLTEEVRFTS